MIQKFLGLIVETNDTSSQGGDDLEKETTKHRFPACDEHNTCEYRIKQLEENIKDLYQKWSIMAALPEKVETIHVIIMRIDQTIMIMSDHTTQIALLHQRAKDYEKLEKSHEKLEKSHGELILEVKDMDGERKLIKYFFPLGLVAIQILVTLGIFLYNKHS